MSNLSAFGYIQERSEATPGLFNLPLSIISANIAALDSGLTSSSPSGNTFSFLTNIETSGGAHFQHLSIGSTPSSYATTAAITVEVNSAYSDYLYFVDSSAQKSSYVIGSRAGNLADGLNIWDASAGTMIASFSKQSIRFFQNVVGPVFDVGGALASTYNAGTFGTGAQTVESRIQAAINQASIDRVARVYIPANMYPYSASSVSFIHTVQLVREGGSWDLYDAIAYGSHYTGSRDATRAIQGALSGASYGGGGTVYFPPGIYSLDTNEAATSGTLQVGPNTVLQGTSSSTLLMGPNKGLGNLALIALAVGASSMRFFDLRIDGASIAGGFTAIAAPTPSRSSDVIISRCGIHRFSNAAVSIPQADRVRITQNIFSSMSLDCVYCSANDLHFIDNICYDYGDTGIAVDAYSTAPASVGKVVVANNSFDSGIGAVALTNLAGGQWQGVVIGSNVARNIKRGMWIQGFTGTELLIANNSMFSCGSPSPNPAIDIQTCNEVRVLNNTIDGNGLPGYLGIQCKGPCNNIDIIGNRILNYQGSGGDCIYAESLTNSLIAGNSLGTCAQGIYIHSVGTSYNIDIIDNVVQNASGTGILVDGSASSNLSFRLLGNNCAVGNGTAITVPSSALVEYSHNADSSTYSGQHQIASGRAIAPGYTFRSETSLGLYRSGISTLAQSYGSTLLAPALGDRVGIGVTAPIDVLDVRGTGTGRNGIQLYNTTAGAGNSAHIIIGSDGGTGLLELENFSSTFVGIGGQCWIYTTGTTPLIWGTGGTERARLQSGGSFVASQQMVGIDGTAILPSQVFNSDISLGWYRSGVQTIAQSYGTLDLTAAIASIGTLRIKSGANNSCGTAVLGSNGSVNVANTYVKTGDLIFLTDQTAGGTLGDLELGGIRNSSGFTIQSTSLTDTSTVAWLIVRPG